VASEPYWRPEPPSYVRALNERQRLADPAPIKESPGHLTISDGEADWGAAPPVGRTIVYKPIELSWDNPDVMLVIDWTVGLTEAQVETVKRASGTQAQLDFLADGFRQSNLALSVPETNIRRPRYVHPTDAANPDAAGLITETVHEGVQTADSTPRHLVIPEEAERDLVPIVFSEVSDEDLPKVKPVDSYRRARGPAGSRGPLRRFRGHPLDSKHRGH
jgi:hypothetical protein